MAHSLTAAPQDTAAAAALHFEAKVWLDVGTNPTVNQPYTQHDTKKFTLLFLESVANGYRRKVLGLRALGIIVSLLSVFRTHRRVHQVIRQTTGAKEGRKK